MTDISETRTDISAHAPDKSNPLTDISVGLPAKTARAAGLVGCRRCAQTAPLGTAHCRRCGARLKSRAYGSLGSVWLFWALGVIAYIPANIWPMLETRLLLTTSDDTIIEGALKLLGHGSILIVLVILLASVVIPLTKFAAIAWLALSVQYRLPSSPVWRHRVYEGVEIIGRWSMIDVFVVAILSSLVQFSLLANVKPGPAAFAFALSVIFTMLSALAFDSRMIWDLDDDHPLAGEGDNLPTVEEPAPAER
ncbi:MAG: paraquat-inducible protein A [Pseudomonadota bacterium]